MIQRARLEDLYLAATDSRRWDAIVHGDGTATVEAQEHIEGPIATCRGNANNAFLIAAMFNALPSLLAVLDVANEVTRRNRAMATAGCSMTPLDVRLSDAVTKAPQ